MNGLTKEITTECDVVVTYLKKIYVTKNENTHFLQNSFDLYYYSD